MKQVPHKIIISRTDSIGDVVLTLPVAAVLKKHFPDIKIAFLGKAYTKPVINACHYIDEFIDIDDFMRSPAKVMGGAPDAILHVLPSLVVARRARQLRIPLRIGTSNRWYHWLTCNRLVFFTRRRSSLHEAQLNLKPLRALGINAKLSLEKLGTLYGLDKLQPLPEQFAALLQGDKYNLILHPKSQGNGREWGIPNFIGLIRLLDKNRYRIFISGTQKERPLMQALFDEAGDCVTDITGRMTLGEFISFIARADGLVASGTGPLHLAAALGRDALGIFPPISPVHPGRWAPLGPGAQVFVLNKSCSDCRNSGACHCIGEVSPQWLKEALDKKNTITR